MSEHTPAVGANARISRRKQEVAEATTLALVLLVWAPSFLVAIRREGQPSGGLVMPRCHTLFRTAIAAAALVLLFAVNGASAERRAADSENWLSFGNTVDENR